MNSRDVFINWDEYREELFSKGLNPMMALRPLEAYFLVGLNKENNIYSLDNIDNAREICFYRKFTTKDKDGKKRILINLGDYRCYKLTEIGD